jgi:hypothetical protein
MVDYVTAKKEKSDKKGIKRQTLQIIFLKEF